MADPQTADPLAPYSDTIDAAAHEWGQDPTMLRALILQESGGRPGAVSSAGARGLGQIIPKTATGLGITDPSDPAQQIFGAAKYLAEGFAKEKTPEGALLYYHGGPDYRKHYGPESDAYVPGVAAHYTRLSKGAGNDNAAAVPSDEEFLKQAAPAPAAAVPSDEEFLKSTGAAPGQEATPFKPETAETQRIGDLMTPGPPTSAPAPAPAPPKINVPGVSGPPHPLDIGQVGQAAREGYDSGAVVTPAGVAWAEQHGLGAIPRGINMLAGAGGAVSGGALNILGQAADTVFPGSGRDAVTGAQLAAPFIMSRAAPGGNRLAEGAARADWEAAKLDRASPLSPEFKASPMAPGVAEKIAPPAGPRAAGAEATPPPLAEMSMAEYKANRKQGELNAIMEPPQAAEDHTTYVEGSVPTLAERAADPAISQHETLLRQRDPNSFEARLTANRDARVKLFEEDMGSAPAREAINQDVKDLAQREQPVVLRGAKPLDLTKPADVLDSIINDPRQAEVDAVRKVIAPLRDALYDADGKLKTNPLSGWGMIDNIRNKIDNAGLETSQERHVVSQLMAAKEALTEAMDQATDGRFGDYLGKQAALLQQRNAMDVLQKFRPQFTNAQGNIQFAAFHRWMLGLARQRGAAGIDPAMAIPDATMQKLIAIDKDLKRSLNIDLGKARGSPTNLLFSLSKQMGLGLVHAGVHGGVAAMGGGGVGNLLAQTAMAGGEAKIARWNLARQVRKHLAEPPAGENWLAGH